MYIGLDSDRFDGANEITICFSRSVTFCFLQTCVLNAAFGGANEECGGIGVHGCVTYAYELNGCIRKDMDAHQVLSTRY